MKKKCWKLSEKEKTTLKLFPLLCIWTQHSQLFTIHRPATPTNSGQTPLWIGKPFHLILWIKEFLCNQLWHVKWNGCLSNEPVLNASVPEGSAISSFLLSIYTDQIMCNNNCLVLIKHADNAAQEACLIPSQSQQKKTMLQSCHWFYCRHLRQNVTKNQWDLLHGQEEQLASCPAPPRESF